MIKNNIKSFLAFSKKEFNGIAVFCVLFISIISLPDIYAWIHPSPAFDATKFEAEIAAFEAGMRHESENKRNAFEDKHSASARSITLFVFNPNNLPEKSWEKLGLTAKQIKVIKNFEAKGGRFYKKEDLKKIYSIKPSDYLRLERFISIPENSIAAKGQSKVFNKPYSAKKAILVELNSADSATLETLPGIGPAFASRIVKYRLRLGGFYNIAQLKEVYGLDSNKLEELKPYLNLNLEIISKISINTATFEDLKKHPYLSYKQINALLKYRNQHGKYKVVEDIKNIAIIDEEIFRRIAPYLQL